MLHIYIYIYIYDISSLRVNTSAHCSGRKQVKGSTITDARVLHENDTLKKTGRTFVWDSHRPLQRVANVKSSVANEGT